MKELSVEEKAHRYDKAIERANNLHKDAVEMENNMTTKTCEIIFPELKDEDERIRKELISFFTERAKYTEDSTFNGLSSKEIIAWLEKLGEQNPVKTPQWMIDFIDDHRRHFASPMEYDERREVDGKLLCIREYLEGKYIEQKSAWSEEDDIMANDIDYALRCQITYTKSKLNCMSSWIGSLKDRVQPQPKWTEEDEKTLNSILSCIKHCQDEDIEARYNGNCNVDPKRYEPMSDWLKSLKPQPQWKPSDKHYELEEFAKIVRCNLTGISKAVQELFEAKYLQLTGNKIYEGFKD